MPIRRPRPCSLAALLTVTALAGATPAATAVAQTSTMTPSATTTTGPAPKPKLALFWAVLTHHCWTATKTVKVKTEKRVKVGTKSHTKTVIKKVKKRVRKCGERPSKASSRVLHLRWRQHGEVFGHLTLAGRPIANANVTLESAIPKWTTSTINVLTNVHGRFSALITGPDKTITLTYSPGPGTEVVATKKVRATAHLSLKVGRLHAGHRARFSGTVFGGHIPQDLYIQFWYYAGPTGWQPFSHLAIVHRRNGQWSTDVPIPADSRGYRYEIKATVVASPDWPWSHTGSRIVTRIVS